MRAGRQTVRVASAEGYEFIKVYGKLDLDTFTAIVDEARKLGMRVIGHIPQREKNLTERFFQPGFDLVETRKTRSGVVSSCWHMRCTVPHHGSNARSKA